MTKKLNVFIDGASRGNPGPAGVGVIIYDNGVVIKEVSESIGLTTNNVAEYSALIRALKECKELEADEIDVKTDSELVYKQVTGQYKVKNSNIKSLFEEVRQLISNFSKCAIAHIPREQNSIADKLASQATKKQTDVVAPLFQISEEESPSSKG